MSCTTCTARPVFRLAENNRPLCGRCFISWFESKVSATIKSYSLISKGQKVAVALSGGKDSSVLLALLAKLSRGQRVFSLAAIAVDEGIAGYREQTLAHAAELCSALGIELHTTAFKEAYGSTLDELVRSKKARPCSACGVLRRALLNKTSRELGFDVLATAHNADDEAQSLLMNTLRGSPELNARLGPVSGVIAHSAFVRRIKPLYFLTNKEIRAYALLNGISPPFGECPYSEGSLRAAIRDWLDCQESVRPGLKRALIAGHLRGLAELRAAVRTKELAACSSCGQAAGRAGMCAVCALLARSN